MKRGKDQTTSIFINPRGFIEQHYYGTLEPKAILDGLKSLRVYAKKLEAQGKPVLILEDVSNIDKLEFLSPKMARVRQYAAKTTKEINFKKAAVYGPRPYQVIITTLALIAGKTDKFKAFNSRAEAVKWLLSKS